MSTTDVINYYVNLLILQYLQKPRARATIATIAAAGLLPDSNLQTITFSTAPVSGAFKINYNGVDTSSISWNASAATIQTDLNAILTAPLTVAVTGTIATGLTFTFSGYTSAVQIMSVDSNTLVDVLANACLPVVTPVGDQISLEILNGFNINGSNTAVGNQLDTIGKYVGVSRNGFGFSAPITLSDADFLTLIQVAIIRNRSGSSLPTIQALLNQYFPAEIYLTDFANMHMSYLISTSIGSTNVIELFVTEGLLPRPMGVGISVIQNANINKFFAFRTYQADIPSYATPWNNYSAYDSTHLFMSYQYSVSA